MFFQGDNVMNMTCIRCGKPVKLSNAYHVKRAANGMHLYYHAYDCVEEGSKPLNDDNLFRNGVVVCPCGEPLITESSLPCDKEYRCENCRSSYDNESVSSIRVPGRVTVLTLTSKDNISTKLGLEHF